MFRVSLVAMAVSCLPIAASAANFTTVAEVKPILEATQSSWIAVREFNGQDLLYFTQIESWRCGLRQVRYRVNATGDTQVKQMEPCYADTPTPNAFKQDGHLPYVTLPPGSMDSVVITLVFKDGSELSGEFQRADIELR